MLKFAVIGSLALLLGASSAVQANLLTNGGLEKSSGASVNQYNLIYVQHGGNQIPGWTITSGSVDLVPGASSGTMYWQNTEGAYSVDMIGTGGLTTSSLGAIQQTVSTTASNTYTLTFDFSINPEQGIIDETGTVKTLRVTALAANGTTVLATQDYSGTKGTRTDANMQYIQQTFTFTATGSASTIRLAAIAPNIIPTGATANTLNCGPVVDNLDLEAGGGASLPEPSSLGLLGVGAMGLLMRRRNRA